MYIEDNINYTEVEIKNISDLVDKVWLLLLNYWGEGTSEVPTHLPFGAHTLNLVEECSVEGCSVAEFGPCTVKPSTAFLRSKG